MLIEQNRVTQQMMLEQNKANQQMMIEQMKMINAVLTNNQQQPTIQPPAQDLRETIKETIKEELNQKQSVSTSPTPLERYMETRFRRISPQVYEKILDQYQDDPYLHRRFTASISGQPLFIPTRDMSSFIALHNPLMTQYLWHDLLDDTYRTRYRRQWTINNPEQSIRLIFIDDPNAKPEEIISATSEAITYSTRTVAQGSKQATQRAVNQQDIQDIQFDPNTRIGPDTYYVLELKNDMQLQEANVKGHKYYNSIITIYDVDFTIDLNPASNHNLQGQHAFEQTLIRTTANILENRHDMRQVMINIYVIYYYLHNNQIAEHRVNVFKGKKIDDMYTLTVEPTLREQLISQGSDADTETNIFTLDYTRSVISIVMPLAGGAYQEAELEELQEAIKQGKKIIRTLKVGKVKHYKSDYNDNSCFIHILQQAIRNTVYTDYHPDVPKFQTYLKLWKYLDTKLGIDTYKKKITLDQAGMMGSFFDINLSIYDPEGNLLSDNDNTSQNKLNVLYLDEHYSHIFDMYQLPESQEIEIPSRQGKKKAYFKEVINCYYDFETVYDTSLMSAKSIQPYSVSYQLDGTSMNTIMTGTPSTDNIVTKMMEDLIMKMSSQYNKYINKITEDNNYDDGIVLVVNLRMIAYNGMNFDHILLLRYLAMQGYHIPQPPYGNKIHQMTANIHALEIRRKIVTSEYSLEDDVHTYDKIYLRLIVWDPYAFLMKSLDAAAMSFKLEMKKLPFDHKYIQQLYQDGKFEEWLTHNRDLLTQYNEQDVRILKEITVRLRDALMNSSIKVDPLKHGTIAGMCYKLWGNITYKGGLTASHENESGDVEELNITSDILPLYPTPSEVVKYQSKYKPDDTNIDQELDIDDGDEITLLDLDEYSSAEEPSDLEESILGYINEERERNATPKRIVKNKSIAIPVKERIIDSAIRSAVIGGRVEGIVGNHNNQKFVMVDVASEYPYVMMKESYPAGEETVIYNSKEAKKALRDEDTIGIYYCKVNQSALMKSIHHPILPHRSSNGRLDWSMEGTKRDVLEWVPDVTIRQLLNYGAKVTLTRDKSRNGARAIIWNKSERGALFREYVYTFGEMKRYQDELSKKKDKNYNPVIREMSKLMLNSLSGKMAERVHTKKTDYFSYKKQSQLNRKITTLDKHDMDYEPNVITDRMMSLTYDNDKFRLTKPSQIGVFIYAYSRAYMYEHIFSKFKVYYSDTDSAVITEKDYVQLKKQLLPDTNISIVWDGKGDKLFGMLEAEASGFYIQVIAPKSYMLYEIVTVPSRKSQGRRASKLIKKRFKGVGSKSIWIDDSEDEVIERVLDNDDNWYRLFKYLRDHNELKIKDWGIIKSLRDNKFSYREIEKVIKIG